MSELTIGRLLDWLEAFYGDDKPEHNPPEYNTIRAIIIKWGEQQADKNQGYTERNKLVAYLARMYPSHMKLHPAEDAVWETDWRNIVCIHSPAGQMTWHIHDNEAQQFNFLNVKPDPFSDCRWDGHTTEEKYQRLDSLRRNTVERTND